jgi:hypothetical protein
MAFPRPTSEQRRERSELDARYGKIGISAVAAAVRYQGEQRNPAAAAKPREERTEESAARGGRDLPRA